MEGRKLQGVSEKAMDLLKFLGGGLRTVALVIGILLMGDRPGSGGSQAGKR